MADGCPGTGGLSRRRFLAGAAAGTAALAAGCSASNSTSEGSDDSTGSSAERAMPSPEYLEFEGVHQTGIAHPGNANGILAAFTVTADDRGELQSMLQSLSLMYSSTSGPSARHRTYSIGFTTYCVSRLPNYISWQRRIFVRWKTYAARR